MQSTLTDIEVRIHHATDRAVLVSTDGERDGAVWVALSMCEVETMPKGLATITMEQWLAEEKGLV